MPKRSVQQRAGCRSEAFVDKAVSDVGRVWNDVKRDFAIDGQIEFVAADREVTGVAVVTQVKATDEHGSGLGRRRYLVERTIALLHWFRRLHVRWEIRYDIHDALLTLAASIICWRHLQRALR